MYAVRYPFESLFLDLSSVSHKHKQDTQDSYGEMG